MKQIVYRILVLSFIFFIFPFNEIYSSNIDKIKDICISKNEYRLYSLINTFRINNNLSEIPLSGSLTLLAKLHINDLIFNHPDTSICNLHSWSDKGDWRACCYNKYVFDPTCMYNKAKELTKYKAKAYEIVFWETPIANPDSVLKSWINTSASADMILSEGKWENFKWKSIGIAVKSEYAIVWFGEIKDIEENPEFCDKEILLSDTIKIKKEETSNIITKKTGKYYIIYGSLDNKNDAEKRLALYQKNNFPNSVIMNKDNKFRICLSTHNTLKEARIAHKKLSEQYKNAWILKF